MTRINGLTALIISGLAAVIILAVGWFVLVSPQRSKADKLDTQRIAVESELAADQHLLSKPSRARTNATLAAARRALPDTPQVSEILRQLNGFATQSRTELDGITPAAAVPSAGAEAIPISLQFKGRYFGLQQLLKLLRQSADVHGGRITGTGRLYTVDSISFTGSDNNLVSATIAPNAFVYATPPVPVTSTTTTTATTTTSSASAASATP